MVQKRKIISLRNLKHSNNKMVLKTSNAIIISLRKESKLENLVFTIKRLLRGLGGPKLRAGCFATLKWLITTIPGHVEYNVYEKVMRKVLDPEARDVKKEVGDVAMGELLAYAIIINTDYLKNYDEKLWMIIALRIMAIAVTKSYLHYAAFKNLSVLYSRFDIKSVPDEILEHLKAMDTHALDKLYFIISLQPVVQAIVIKVVFRTKQSLTERKVLKRIVNIIMKETIASCEHPFYDLFVHIITSDIKYVKSLWSILMKVIKTPDIHNMKIFLPFVSLLIENVKDLSYVVFSMIQIELIEFMKLKQNSQDIKDFLNILHKRLCDYPNLRLATVCKFLFEFKFVHLEACTGTNFICKQIIKLDLSEIKTLVQQCRLFLADNIEGLKDENVYKSEAVATFRQKLTIFKYFASLINNRETKNERDWKCEQLKFVIDAGVFIGIIKTVNKQLSDAMYNCLYNAVGTLGNIFLYRQLLVSLIEHIAVRLEEEQIMRVKITGEERKILIKNIKWLNFKIKLNNESDELSPTVCVEVVGLFLLINSCQNPRKFLALFKDVKIMFLKLDDPSWTEFLINIMISLLFESPAYNRAFVNSMFKMTIKYFNMNALNTLSNLFLLNELSDDSDDESDEDEPCNKRKKIKLSESGAEYETPVAPIVAPPHISTQQRESDDDMIDVDEMTEEERQRLNLILQGVALSKKVTEKKKQSESSLSHVRIRHLDLIEICRKQANHVPFKFWLNLVPNLYKLLRQTESSDAETSLHARLRGALKKISAMPFHKLYTNPTDDTSCRSLIVINLLLDHVSRGLQKDDKQMLLNICRALLVHSNIYYYHPEYVLDFTRFTLLIQFYMKQFYRRRKIIPVSFFISLCEAKWEGMRKLINVAGKLTFWSETRINRRLLGFKIINAYFSSDYYIGDDESEPEPEELEVFLSSFLMMSCDRNLYEKPDCLLKFIPQLYQFIDLLRSKNRSDLFNIPQLKDAVECLKLEAVQYRKSQNLPPYPDSEKSSKKEAKKRPFDNPKLLRI